MPLDHSSSGRGRRAAPARARLAPVLERAGFPTPTLRLESGNASGPAAIDTVHHVSDAVATLLPTIERLGVASASEVALPSLTQRIVAEIGADGPLVGRADVGVWTRL